MFRWARGREENASCVEGPQQLEQKLLQMTWLRTLLPGDLAEQSALLWLLSDIQITRFRSVS